MHGGARQGCQGRLFGRPAVSIISGVDASTPHEHMMGQHGRTWTPLPVGRALSADSAPVCVDTIAPDCVFPRGPSIADFCPPPIASHAYLLLLLLLSPK